MPSGKKRRATTRATRGGRSIIVAAVFGTLSAMTGVWLMLPTDTIARRGNPGARHKAPIGVWFEEVSGPSGISFRHISGRGSRLYMPEIMVGGVALFDFDNDGLLDAYFVQSGFLVEKGERRPSNKMYRNQGNAGFEDVTASSGTGDLGYGMGCACGDFDNDGGLLLTGAAATAAEPPLGARREVLMNLLLQDCGSCHGLTMKGGLGPPLLPRTLAGTPDAALVEAILDGRAGTPMPPWRVFLDAEEAAWMVRQLKEGLTP